MKSEGRRVSADECIKTTVLSDIHLFPVFFDFAVIKAAVMIDNNCVHSLCKTSISFLCGNNSSSLIISSHSNVSSTSS